VHLGSLSDPMTMPFSYPDTKEGTLVQEQARLQDTRRISAVTVLRLRTVQQRQGWQEQAAVNICHKECNGLRDPKFDKRI
jgi:hypothetical protein